MPRTFSKISLKDQQRECEDEATLFITKLMTEHNNGVLRIIHFLFADEISGDKGTGRCVQCSLV